MLISAGEVQMDTIILTGMNLLNTEDRREDRIAGIAISFRSENSLSIQEKNWIPRTSHVPAGNHAREYSACMNPQCFISWRKRKAGCWLRKRLPEKQKNGFIRSDTQRNRPCWKQHSCHTEQQSVLSWICFRIVLFQKDLFCMIFELR